VTPREEAGALLRQRLVARAQERQPGTPERALFGLFGGLTVDELIDLVLEPFVSEEQVRRRQVAADQVRADRRIVLYGRWEATR
jgi:hypothetical protein